MGPLGEVLKKPLFWGISLSYDKLRPKNSCFKIGETTPKPKKVPAIPEKVGMKSSLSTFRKKCQNQILKPY